MAFTVTYSNGTSVDFSDDARWKLLPSGVLQVVEDKRRWHYSPPAWSSVEEKLPEPPATTAVPIMAAPDEPDWVTRQF